MGRMKNYLIECQELLIAGEYERLLLELKPWKDEAPAQLWAVVAWLAVQNNPSAGFIDYLAEGDRTENLRSLWKRGN